MIALRFVLLTALLLYALWCVPFVATHDGPNHLASCVLANRLEDPASPLHRYLELGAPVTNLGFQLVCETFEPWFGWRAAYALTLTVIALLWVFGYAWLARAVDRRSPFLFAGFISAFGWAFYMGFSTWMLTVGIAFFTMAFFISRPSLNVRVWAVIALLIFIAAAAHTFVAAMLGLAIVLLAYFRGASFSERSRLVARAVVCGVPAAVLALLSATSNEPGATAWRSLAEKLADVSANYVGGPWYRSILPAWGAVIAFGVASIAAFRRHTSPVQNALLSFAAFSLFAYAALPYHFEHWAYLGPRPMIIGLAIAPLAIPGEYFDRRFLRPIVSWSTAALAAIALIWAALHHRALSPHVQEALAGLEAPIVRTGGRLPLMFAKNPDSSIAEARPLLMILHLYSFDQGGVDPYVWADDPPKDRVLFKAPPAELFGAFPSRSLEHDLECAGKRPTCPPLEVQYEHHVYAARNYEDSIVFADDPEVFRVFERRGFLSDFRQGRLGIFRPQNCRATVHVAGSGIVRVVRSVIGAPVIERVVEGSAEVAIDGKDCGTLLIEPCVEAGERRFLALEVTPAEAAEITCSVRAEPK